MGGSQDHRKKDGQRIEGPVLGRIIHKYVGVITNSEWSSEGKATVSQELRSLENEGHEPEVSGRQ